MRTDLPNVEAIATVIEEDKYGYYRVARELRAVRVVGFGELSLGGRTNYTLECVCLQDSSLRPTETSSNRTSSFDFFQVNKERIFHVDDTDLYSFRGSSSAVHTF